MAEQNEYLKIILVKLFGVEKVEQALNLEEGKSMMLSDDQVALRFEDSLLILETPNATKPMMGAPVFDFMRGEVMEDALRDGGARYDARYDARCSAIGNPKIANNLISRHLNKFQAVMTDREIPNKPQDAMADVKTQRSEKRSCEKCDNCTTCSRCSKE